MAGAEQSTTQDKPQDTTVRPAEGGDFTPLPPGKSLADLNPSLAGMDAALNPQSEDAYRKEWGKYRAVVDLPVGAVLAVAKGGQVPASHPLVPYWLENEMIETVEQQA